MAHWQRTDNWLQGIAAADHPNHGIKTDGSLTPEMVQSAFDKTYGPKQFQARDHGTVITVWSVPGYIRYCEAKADYWRGINPDRAADFDDRIQKEKSKLLD